MPTPFGVSFGTKFASSRSAGSTGRGLPQTKNYGSSLRATRVAPVAAASNAMEDAERMASSGAASAARTAERAATNSGGNHNDSIYDPKPPKAPTGYESYGAAEPGDEKPPALSSSMGIKPDFTERNRQVERLKVHLNRGKSFFAGQIGDNTFENERENIIQLIKIAEAKAHEDAAYAQAALPERYEDVPNEVVPGTGQKMERGVRSGNVRPAYTKEVSTVDFDNASELQGTPYELKPFEMTKEEPRFDAKYLEAMKPKEPTEHFFTDEEGIPHRFVGGKEVPIADASQYPKKSVVQKGLIGDRTAGQIQVRETVPARAPSEPKEPAPPTESAIATEKRAIRAAAVNEVDMYARTAAENGAPWTLEKIQSEVDRLTAKGMENVPTAGVARGSNQLPLGPGATADYGGPVAAEPAIGTVQRGPDGDYKYVGGKPGGRKNKDNWKKVGK